MYNAFGVFSTVLLTVVALTLIYMFFEARWVKVTKINYRESGRNHSRLYGRFHDEAINDQPLKIMNLSDIHIKFLRVSPDKVKMELMANKPDLVLLSGDYLENIRYAPGFFEFLSKSGITEIPCYGVFGNHDYEAADFDDQKLGELAVLMKSKGLHILRDESITFNKNGKKYNITGLKDLRDMNPDFAKAYEDTDKKALLNITLAHNPDTVLYLSAKKTDLILAGHFHGGQIWLPFNLEYKVFRSEKLCNMGITRGMHHVNHIDLYINRGLGNVVIPLRFLSRPEILFIEV